MTDSSGMITQQTIEKPWGKEVIWASTKDYVGKILIIEKNSQLSLQYHSKKTETILLVSGDLVIRGEDGVELACLKPGGSYHIAPNTIHRFCALDTTVTLIEVSTPELDDVVRIEDDYGR